MSRVIDIELEARRVCIIFPYDRSLLPVVRSLPGRWFDRGSKNWYVPLEHVEQVIGRLSAHHFKLSAELRDYCEEVGKPVDASANASGPAGAALGGLRVPDDTYSISQLNEEARQALRQKFSDDLWLVGEVQGYERNRPSGHAYFELVERFAPNEDPVARIRAVMFAEDRRKVEEILANAPEPIRLRDGLAVRLSGRIDLYAPSGSYQFIVHDADPSYTTGEIYQNRERVLALLDELGIRAQNQERPWAPCPLRVGLITGFESDAYNDFVHELSRSGYGFQVQVHNANVQGTQTEPSVLRALDHFARNAADFDVLAIVRGGGSRSDLAYFDTEAIGKAVCEHPLKVVVGVGHQRDQCVLDFVAESQKTPTAAAQTLVRRVQAYREGVEDLYARIADRATEQCDDGLERLRRASVRLERAVESCVKVETRRLGRVRSEVTYAARSYVVDATRRLDRLERAIPAAALTRLGIQAQKVEFGRTRLSMPRLGRRLADKADRLDALQARLERAAAVAVAEKNRELEAHRQKLRLLDPQRVLERGFSIMFTDWGVVRRPEDAAVGTDIRVRLARGEIRVRRTEDAPDSSE
jgi:exodeoxyribonuclease VII large subunit